MLAGLVCVYADLLSYMLLCSLTNMHAGQHMYSHINKASQHHLEVLKSAIYRAHYIEHPQESTLNRAHNIQAWSILEHSKGCQQ